MTVETLKRLLAWSTLINYAILIIWFVACALSRNGRLQDRNNAL
jgi:hypothetical protein